MEPWAVIDSKYLIVLVSAIPNSLGSLPLTYERYAEFSC